VAVGAGILTSRVFGLVRQRVVSHFLGVGDAADVISAALRIPNVLQNLLGEGVLSASFVPVYARLRAEGREGDATQLARTVFAALAAVCAVLVALGIALAPWLVAIIAGGFPAEKRAFVVFLVRILFPGMGLLVMSAWCLGVLNAHRRFFVSYTSPIAWNLAIIGALAWRGARTDEAGAATLVAAGAAVGGLLQFAVQVPWVLRAVPGIVRPHGARPSHEFARVVANFGPALLGRGAVQLSGWLDLLIASYVASTGAAAVLMYAQNIALLPVSVFGMAMSASELTEMSHHAEHEVADAIRGRLTVSLRAIAYLVVPSSAALLFLGDAAAGAVLQTGRFGRADTMWVWSVLAGSAIGLLAGTMGRLYNSAWYALHDTRTPVRIALVRIAVTGVLGAVAALLLPGWFGLDPKWGVAGLSATAGLAAWLEFAMLRRALNARIGPTGLPRGTLPPLWAAALVAAAAGYGIKLSTASAGPLPSGLAVFVAFGMVYWGVTMLLRVPEARAVSRRVAARFAWVRN
jgi:putative peptidoglycan lipid II flippase